MALSRPKQEFEFPMGHILPDVFNDIEAASDDQFPMGHKTVASLTSAVAADATFSS